MCMPLFRGSLKRGRQQRLHLLSQVHSTSPHGKAGLFSFSPVTVRSKPDAAFHPAGRSLSTGCGSAVPALTVADLGERALIARIKARVSMPAWVVIGPGADAAVIQPARGTFDVVTTDAQVEGVHFDRRFVPPDAIGHRALAVNLSDLAAMGALPRAALLSLALGAAFLAMAGGLLVVALASVPVRSLRELDAPTGRPHGPVPRRGPLPACQGAAVPSAQPCPVDEADA